MVTRSISLDLALYWFGQYKQLISRIMVLTVIVMTSAYFAPRIVTGNSLFALLFLFILGLSVGLVFLKLPSLGLVVFIPTSLLVPFGFGTGTGTDLSAPVLLVLLLSGLWVFDMGVRQKRLNLFASRVLLAMGIFVLIAILAFILGLLTWVPLAQHAPINAQIAGLAVFIVSALAFVLAVHQITDLRWLQAITWVFLIIGAVYIIGRFIPALGIRRFFQWGSDGSLFWLWLVAISFSQAVFNRDLKPFWRLALLGLAVATFSFSLFQFRDWASGWLPALAAVVIIVSLRSWRVALGLILVGVIIKLVTDPGLFGVLAEEEQYSIDTRWVAYEIVLQLARANPILGLGMSNYYHYTPIIPIMGWYVEFNSHSQYIDLIAQTGILGLICFFWLFVEIGKVGWRLRTQVKDGFQYAYVIGAMGGLVGMLVAGILGDWVLPFVYNVGLVGLRSSLIAWLFLGGLVAVDKHLRNQTC
ncbi:MAG: O-antigen ligase family protein [Anaerolineales bacterium]|nr:O-antigen ligase family protein [Anaerolineales bacterium]